jgi:hypothetical protein
MMRADLVMTVRRPERRLAPDEHSPMAIFPRVWQMSARMAGIREPR